MWLQVLFENKGNDEDILRACKISNTQPRPVAKNALSPFTHIY